jgi:hypothetical protein
MVVVGALVMRGAPREVYSTNQRPRQHGLLPPPRLPRTGELERIRAGFARTRTAAAP